MNFLLILPSPSTDPTHGEFQPIGLCALATYLRTCGHTVRLVHQTFPQVPTDESLIQMASGFDAVGISTYTPNIERSLSLASAIKTKTGIPIILGGPFATSWTSFALRSDVDFIVIGEGEHTTAELLDHLERGESADDIPGLAFGNDKTVIHSAPRSRIRDLDALPIPDISELPHANYHLPVFERFLGAPASNCFALSTSRGCPNRCIFCNSETVWQSKWFAQSVPRVMEELAIRIREGRTAGGFLDMDINVNRQRAFQLYEAIAGLPQKIHWFSEASPAQVDEELLVLMERTGCVGMMFGLEFGADQEGKKSGKRTDLVQFREMIRVMERLGMYSVVSFVIGLPWESRETLQQTKIFIRTLAADLVTFGYADPHPGTPLWHMAIDNGWIKEDLSIYFRSITSPVLPTFYLSKEDLESVQWKLAAAHYFSVPFFARLIRGLFLKPGKTFQLVAAISIIILNVLTKWRRKAP